MQITTKRAKWGLGILFVCLVLMSIWPGRLVSKEGETLPTQTVSDELTHFEGEGAYFAPVSLVNTAPYQRQSTQSITPMPAVQAMMDQVNKAKLRDLVGELSGEWPAIIGGVPYTITTRYTNGGEPYDKALQYAYEHFQSAGLSTSYQPWAIWKQDGSLSLTSQNVIGEITGKTHPNDVFLISAHLDNLPRISYSPINHGADDNASGSAAVLLAAQIMRQYDWNCTLRFALWTGEEQGTVGSNVYAGNAEYAKENILGVINLDMIGWNSIASPNLNLYAISQITQSIHLAEVFSDVVGAYKINILPTILLNYPMGYRSDNRSFWWKNYPAIGVFEESDYDYNDYYHTVNDRLQYLDLNYLANNTKAALGALAHASGCLASQNPLPTMTPTPTGQPTISPTNTPLPEPLFVVGGIVWSDYDRDGLYFGNQDIGMKGITVSLQTTTGEILSETISSVDGNYSFFKRPSGNYVIGFTAPKGYSFTQQNAVYSGNPSNSYTYNSAPAITTGLTAPIVVTGSNYFINAGLVSLATPTPTPTPIPGYFIRGHVWIDKYSLYYPYVYPDGYRNTTSLWGENDPAAYQISVALMSQSGEILQTTTTPQDGSYIFRGLLAGNYIISFTPHAGYAFTIKPIYPQGPLNEPSLANPTTGATDLITLTGNLDQIGAGIVKLPATKFLPYTNFLPGTMRDAASNW